MGLHDALEAPVIVHECSECPLVNHGGGGLEKGGVMTGKNEES
jgi:hypothetical protein